MVKETSPVEERAVVDGLHRLGGEYLLISAVLVGDDERIHLRVAGPSDTD